MSSAVVSILPQAPGLLQNPAFDRTYLLLWGSFQELAIHNGAGLDLKEAELEKARLTGYWERTEGLLAKLAGAQLDLEMLGYCDFQYATLTNCTGQVQAVCFCDWSAVRLLGCDLRVDYWMDCALPQGAFLDSRCQGTLWAHLDLRGASLVNSTLTAERWNDVALDGALLQGADLSGVQTAVNCSWTGALYDEKTRPPAGVELARAGAVPLTEAGLKKWLESAPESLRASLKDRAP